MPLGAHNSTSLANDPPVNSWSRDCRGFDSQIESFLVRCVDAGLAGVLFVVPLILGGRIALGQLILVALTLWIAVCWCLRQSLAPRAVWIRTPAGPLLLLALIFVGLQLVPLPSSLSGALSPHMREVLPLWNASPDGSATLGVWDTLSLAPIATRNALILLIALVLLFLITVQRVQQIGDVERLLRWIAISTLVMAAFGFVQYLTTNGKFFWFYEHPFSDTRQIVKGSFSNRNHFAQFIALGIGPLLWWFQSILVRRHSGKSSRRRPLGYHPEGRELQLGFWIIGFGVCIFAVLMSLSRGGTVAALAAVVVCMLIFYRGSLIGRKTLCGVLGIGAIVGAFLAIHGYEMVAARFDSLGSLDKIGQEERLQLWQAEVAAVADYPMTGTGLASHCEVSPMYFQNGATALGVEYTHAENSYLQVAMEGGIPGLLMAVAAIGLCVFWCLATLRSTASTRVLICIGAIAASFAANFIHSMADFIWYVPGCMVVVVVLAASACRLWQLNRNRRGDSVSGPFFWIPRAGWLAAVGCLLLVGYFMVQNRLMATRAEPFWNRYLALNMNLSTLHEEEHSKTLAAMEEALSATIRREPDHARAHARLAEICLMQFNQPADSEVNPMNVKQVRGAVEASRFESSGAMHEWLVKAFGGRSQKLHTAWRHARQAIVLCPLQGEAYLSLADVSFLDNSRSPRKAAYLSQALRVRPNDGMVLFVAGQEAMLAGDVEQAFEYWCASSKLGPIHQTRLLKLLAPRFPAPVVLEIVRPDRAGLRQMRLHYRKPNRREDLLIVEARLVEASESEALTLQGTPAADCWLEAAGAHRTLGNLPESLRCLRQAVAADGAHFRARHSLGMCLFDLKQFAQAEEHLNWCLQRKPQDAKLRQQVEAAMDGRLRTVSRPMPAQQQPR